MFRSSLTYKVPTIVAFWILAGVLLTAHEFFFLSNYRGVLGTEPMSTYTFKNNLLAACFSLGMGGVLFCLFEFLYFQKISKRFRFWEAILIRFLFYGVIIALLLAVTSYLYNTALSGKTFFDDEAISRTKSFLLSSSILHPILPFMVLIVLSSFYIQITERFSPQEYSRMMSGKYFHPKQEHKIILFLDLNHSTTLAEKLGNEKFYDLINDFFYDIAPVIESHQGEVVEYVGDQIIVSWDVHTGAHKGNCIECIFRFEEVIRQKTNYYTDKYQTVPEFKVAIHSGLVIIGEIGKIKKSIKFNGDVLNTTSRVEGMCRQYNERLLVTENIVSYLKEVSFSPVKITDTSLRGKEGTMGIYKIERS